MDPFYHVPYGRMSGYQLYKQFKAAERDYEKTEVDKAYRDALNRLQIQMSTLLHEYSEDLKYYAYGPLDNHSHQNTYDRLYLAFTRYNRECTDYLYRVARRLKSRIHETLDFHYDLSGYKVDPNDNCYNDERYYYDELKERLKKDQVGKDLLLVAYSAIDFIHYYAHEYDDLDKLKPSKPEVTKLLTPPSAKKPRVVPVGVKRPTPSPYKSRPYIPPTKKSK